MLKSWRLILGALWVVLAIASQSTAQNSATGAIAGTVTDASGAIVVGAQVTVTNAATGEVRRTTSRSDGSILISLLPPGSYSILVGAPGFKAVDVTKVTVTVTETVNVPIHLEVGAADESVTVTGSELQVSTESAELGTVTSRQMIESLPLVTRNYTQIIALNPGISAEMSNAGELGKGSSSYGASTGGFSAQGGNTNDNNFQMNGVTVSDTFASAQFSGGIAVPNPDTLQEFKVLTGQYDASYGRNAGANVNVITRGGTNNLHGSVFEYFRNDALNANDFFQKRNNQPRPVLKSNQFGFTLGGPIAKNKLLFFGSYQGTRQRNGIADGCLSRVQLPPLTDDRSPAALGAIFGGNVGYFNYALGVTDPSVPHVASDGSNINPVALKLLQAKLPNGQYLIPTPQSVKAYTPEADPSVIDSVGLSTFSSPCPYSENQYMGNLDYLQSDKSKWSSRVFVANSQATQSLAAGLPGFGVITPADYRNISLSNSYIFSPAVLNQLTIGFTRQLAGQIQANPYKSSDFGITSLTDGPPVIYLNALTTGLNIGGKGQTQTSAQNMYEVSDSIAWTHGKHTFRFGGGVTRWQYNASNLQYSDTMEFLTFSDLLLGNDANTAGLGAFGFGNLYASVALVGDLARDYRIWEENAWAQDDVRVTKRLTLNLGFRYERLGGMSEKWGRNTSFDFGLADPTPPATGTLAGYLVPSNFRGDVPDGVAKSDNNMGITGEGQNTWNPRFGFAWQLPGTDRLVLRGGYGMFHSRTTGVGLIQSLSAPPLSYVVVNEGAANADATAANPFVGTLPTLPLFPLITPTSTQSPQVLSQSFRPPTYQRFSLGMQTALAKDTVLEVDYVGARGTQLIRQRNIDQAELASVDDPIRGVTTNTSSASNIRARLPYQGLAPAAARIYENGAASWYNSLQVSANKRMSHGLTLQGSYTFARALSDSPGTISATIGGHPNGNTNDPRSTYGPDPFVREHRFVFSYLYNLPGPKDLNSFAGRILGNWSLSGVTVAQSGHRLTFGYTNAANVYGITSDRPDYIPACNINTPGGVESRLDSYWNAACFTKPAALPAPNSGTLFGTSPIGLGHGPGQINFDVSIAKQFPVKWPTEVSNLEFYTQFFNAMNHPQFADPSTQFTGTGFGATAITSTITNPRIIQFALKYSF